MHKEQIAVLSKADLADIARQAADFAIESARQGLIPLTPEVMTMPQLCAYLQFSRPTVLKAIETKGLPVKKCFGTNAPRFIKKDVDEWLRRQA
jgi:excisionase family DNA binding protein